MASNRISTIPSIAILQAVADMETVEICMGGATLARIKNFRPKYFGHLEDIPAFQTLDDDEQNMIMSLDDIRLTDKDNIEAGLDNMGVPTDVARAALDEVAPSKQRFSGYSESPTLFKLERRAIAFALQRRGY